MTHRSAIVAATPAELVSRLRGLRGVHAEATDDSWSTHSLDHRTWSTAHHPPVSRPRIAFVFPGPTLELLGAGRWLVERFDWARALLTRADDICRTQGLDGLAALWTQRLDGVPARVRTAWAQELLDSSLARPAAALVSVMWLEFLRRQNAQPELVTGHDVGALVALHAAGALDFERLFALASARGLHGTWPQCQAARPSMTVLDANGDLVSEGQALASWLNQSITEAKEARRLLKETARRADLILEVGASRAVTLGAIDVLGRRGVPCISIETRSRNDRDLNVALAALFAAGVKLDSPAIYAGRCVHPYVPFKERSFFRNPCERPFPPNSKEHLPAPTVATSWVEQLGVSAELLQGFIDKSGHVLTELVREDLLDLETRGELVLPDTFLRTAPNILQPVASTTAASMEVESGDATQGEDIEGSLVALLVEKTGYPEGSISLQSRLLDDLNLDSIKAAEVVGAIARNFGADGQIDASMFANASIQEIAAAVRGVRMNGGIDLNSLEDGPRILRAHELQDPPWVRNFASNILCASPLPHDAGGLLREEEDWPSAVVLILADQEASDPHARALADRLGRLGATVAIWPYSAEAALERGRFSHTFALVRADVDADTSHRLQRIVDRLHAAATVSSGPNRFPRQRVNALIYLTFSGGRWAGAQLDDPLADAGVTSFAASVHLERSRQRVRALDFSPALSPENVVELAIREVESEGSWSAAGYDKEAIRRELRISLQDRSMYTPRPATWSKADVILATGGARGITAECALALAKATGARLALLGSTAHIPNAEDPTQVEIAHNLARAADAGLEARYYAADVTNEDAVQAVIATIEREFGSIKGVIHGAGFNQPKPAEQLSKQEAFRQLGPKYLGAKNLMARLDPKQLKMFSVLTSIIGVAGIQGNAWYALGNELTDLLLGNFHARTGVPVVAAAYGIWSEVGMGARLGAVSSVEKMGTSAVAPEVGAKRFVELVQNDPGCRQVVVTARLAPLDTWRSATENVVPSYRYLERQMRCEPGVDAVFRTQLDLERDHYLRDHTWSGSALFPAVFGVEAMVQVASCALGRTLAAEAVTLEDVRLIRPIIVHPEYGAEIQVSALVEEAEGGQATRVICRITSKAVAFRSDCFTATLVVSPTSLVAHDPTRADRRTATNAQPADFYGSHLFHGPDYQRITQIEDLSRDQVSFKADFDPERAAKVTAEWAPLTRDPFFLDTLLHGLALGRLDRVALPTRIERIHLSTRAAAGSARVSAAVVDINEEDYRGDVVAVAADGTPIARFEGVWLRTVEHRGEGAAEAPSRYDVVGSAAAELQRAAASLKVALPPLVTLTATPGIDDEAQETRRARTRPLLEEAVRRLEAAGAVIGEGVSPAEARRSRSVAWSEQGRPEAGDGKEIQLSLSHHGGVTMVVAGTIPQGCDLVAVVPRDLNTWVSMMGQTRRPVLEALMAHDSASIGGARVWAAIECMRKSSHEPGLMRIIAREGNAVLLSVESLPGEHKHVLTWSSPDATWVIGSIVSVSSGA